MFIPNALTIQAGQSVLWQTSFARETECVKLLLKYGAQVDLPVRCELILGCGVLFGKTGRLVQIGWAKWECPLQVLYKSSAMVNHSTRMLVIL